MLVSLLYRRWNSDVYVGIIKLGCSALLHHRRASFSGCLVGRPSPTAEQEGSRGRVQWHTITAVSPGSSRALFYRWDADVYVSTANWDIVRDCVTGELACDIKKCKSLWGKSVRSMTDDGDDAPRIHINYMTDYTVHLLRLNSTQMSAWIHRYIPACRSQKRRTCGEPRLTKSIRRENCEHRKRRSFYLRAFEAFQYFYREFS